ncbi:flavodoxin domain-containing protein [uncultured Meiothermus sp.]|uniref:flavodoxin domain-containing protein n=1 Tax=uncultured Meiothermus sp. TaxID=157471 RepID=UPI002626478E|nr:flavodoxin domain-containing protein [uncultured Meiothermus sp.]
MQTWLVLIAYASRLGSTREIAQAIGEVLAQRGARVEVLPVEEVQHIEDYQAIIVGSSIRDQAWLPEARRFIQIHLDRLQALPLVYFMVCGQMSNPTPEHFHEVYEYSREMRELVEPIETGIFSGSLDYSRLSHEERVSVLSKGLPEGDFRRWQDIRAWAEDVYDRLQLQFARSRAEENIRP